MFVVSKWGHGLLVSPAQPAALAALDLDVRGRPGFRLPGQGSASLAPALAGVALVVDVRV